MDEPVPIEGIVEGEPESLAAVCAAGGSAIIAYCSAVGVRADAAETVVAALAAFRRGVVESADRDPSELEKLLLTCASDAARGVAGVTPSREREATAQVALETAETAPLAPGLAPRIIRALVEAAPVSALGGDVAAVRRATEQHYIGMFDGAQVGAAFAPAPGAISSAIPPADAEAGWVPPELSDLDTEAANARAVVAPEAEWSSVPAAPAPFEPPEHAPLPPPTAPTVPPPPGALVIKRGGHWPFRRPPRKRSPARSAKSGRGPWTALATGIAGLALGAGIAAVALPEKEADRPATLVRLLDTPFTVNGAVFNVARTNQTEWALAIRERPPRQGHTWLTLAVQTRNADRPSFLPRALGYRLRTADGIVIGPDSADVPGNLTAAGWRQAIGERSSVHLGFQVPSAQLGLTLEFDPSPQGPRIRVPLN